MYYKSNNKNMLHIFNQPIAFWSVVGFIVLLVIFAYFTDKGGDDYDEEDFVSTIKTNNN